MNPATLSEPVLVGRATELGELSLCLDLAFDGKGRTVFISGNAGSGKTRLANEFLSVARRKGANVLSGWCLSNAVVPYFPFIEAFEEYILAETDRNQPSNEESTKGIVKPVDHGALSTAEWLKGPKRTENFREYSEALNWKDSTFAAVSRTLFSISRDEPTILFLEDIHWADSASLSLLHYIARMIGSSRILLVATFRSEELTVDAEGYQKPLVDLLQLMSRENLHAEIKLSDLGRTSVAEIAENMVGGDVDSELIDRITSESQGNPLFVVESMRMLSEHGSLFEKDNCWHISVSELGIPRKIRDVILRRLGVLKSSQRRVLEVASVIGETFDVALLSSVLNQDMLEVLETLNTISESSRLVTCQGDTYKFDHAKSREIIYEEIPLPLKKGYHTRIAQKLESKPAEERPIDDLAHHYSHCGNVPKAIEYSLAAGENALSRFSNTEAIQYFRYVIDTIKEASEFTKERITALEGLADGYFAKGLFKEALKTYLELSNDAESSGLVKLRSLRKASAAARWGGDLLNSLEIANRASEYGEFDRIEFARVQMNSGWALCLRGKTKDGLTNFEKALKVFEEEYALADAANVLTQEASFGATLHEYSAEKSLQMGLRACALHDTIQDLRGQVEATFFVGTVFSNCILTTEAIQAYNNAIELGKKIADYNHLAWLHIYLTLSLEFMGDFQNALSVSIRGVEFAERTDSFYVQSMIYANIVRIAAKIGDEKRAEEADKKLIQLMGEVECVGSKIAIAVGKRSMAVFLASKNLYEDSTKLAEESLQLLKEMHHKLFEAMLRIDYAWILDRQGKNQEAVAQKMEVVTLLGELRQSFETAKIELDIMVPRICGRQEEFKIRFDLVNVSSKPVKLEKIVNIKPADFKLVTLPKECSIVDESIKIDGKEVAAFGSRSFKFTLEAPNGGEFEWTPSIVYSHNLGELVSNAEAVKVTVRAPKKLGGALLDRVSTGFADLDQILLGGIPREYAVILSAPVSDERELLLRRFVKSSLEAEQATLCISAEIGNAKSLAEEFPQTFYLLLCNSHSDSSIKDSPRVFKLKGVENLTDIDIALTKALRTMGNMPQSARVACVDSVSDVLLQHHAVITRKWLSGLLQELKSRGFTTLAVVDPQMHQVEEVQAIIGLFDGEIRITERETEKGAQKMLSVIRLSGKTYSSSSQVFSLEKPA